MRDLPRRLQPLLGHAWRGVVLACAWLILSAPLVTWMAATVAVVHSVDRAGRPDDEGALPELWQGWRRHWRVAVPVGTVALLALAALVANLLFLSGQRGATAFLLLVGTLLLLMLWAMGMTTLVPTLVLRPDLPRRQSLRLGLLLAFGHPFSTAGLVLGSVVLVTALQQVWPLLTVLAVPVVGYLSLRLARRHLRSVP